MLSSIGGGEGGRLQHSAARGERPSSTALAALLVGVSYYLGSEVGFAIRFPSIPTAIIWPPNSILMAALLLAPARRWWAYLLATLAAHILVQSQTAVPPSTMLFLFVTNAGQAALGAWAVRRLCGGPPRFGYVRDVAVFLFCAVFAASFVTSFLDAAAVVLTKWGDNYWLIWNARFRSNVLTVLTLVPAIVIWAAKGRDWLRGVALRRFAEGCILTLGLWATYAFAYSQSSFGESFAPAMLYAPLPFLIWAALRFGAGGVSTSLLAVLLISALYAIGGRGPFTSQSPAKDIVGLQLFLIAISVPMMMLAAVTEERRRAAEALKESEARNRAILQAIPDMMFLYTRDGTYLDYYARNQKDLSVPPENFLGKNVREVLPPDVAESLVKRIRQVNGGSEPQVTEYNFALEGKKRWFESRIVRSGENVLNVVRDITERKRAETALSFQARLLDTIEQAAIATDINGVVIFWNHFAERLYGWTKKEALGLNIKDIFKNEASQAMVEETWALLMKGQAWAGEFTLKHRAGDTLQIWLNNSPILDDRGTVVGIVGISHDITERKRAEAALRESEERFRNMANNAPVIVWVTEPGGSCTFLSQTWYDLTGQPPETGLGFGWAECVHPNDRARTLDAYLAANERHEAFRLDYRLRRKDGEYRWMTDSAAPRFGSQGEFLGYIGSLIDITERKRAEQSLEQLTGRLLQLQDEERRRIARELHDTTAQNLLAIVINLETLVQKASTLPRDFVEAVAECQSLCEQTQAEIRTLSYLLHPPMLDEAGLILALEWFIDGFSRRSSIHVDFAAPPDFRRLPSQMETALFRVVQESLTNIYRHSGSATAEIRLERDESQVQLRVKDRGRGINARGNGGGRAKQTGALGVGISGMRERLRQLGGHLEVHSNGVGTSVTAVLPLGKGEER